MAIISTVIGGIGGLLAFLFALLYCDFALLQALGLYLASSFVLTTSMIVRAMAVERRRSALGW